MPAVMVIAAVSLVLAFASVIVVALKGRVNSRELVKVVRRLLAEGNGERVIRLSHALPGAPLLMGLESVVSRAMGSLPVDERGEADYRSDPAGQSAALEGELRATYERTLREPLRVLDTSRWLAVASAALMMAALILHTEMIVWIMAAGMLLVQLWAWRTRRSLRDGARHLIDELCEPLVQGWLRGSLDESARPPRARQVSSSSG